MTTIGSTPPSNRVGFGGGSGGSGRVGGGAWDLLPGGGGFAVSSQSPMSSGQHHLVGGGGGAGGDAASSIGVGASDMDDDDVGGGTGGGGGAGAAWERRGDRAAREKAHRRARTELKRFTASKKFPTNVGVVQVHSLGKVRPDPGFYAVGRLAPVGFRASRTERSPVDESLVHCVMEVLEVPDPDRAGGGGNDPNDDATKTGDTKKEDNNNNNSGAAPADSAAEIDREAGSSSSAAPGDAVGHSSSSGEAPGEGDGDDGARKTVAAFRVILSGLKGERGTFQDFSAGKAWRAALRSIGAEVLWGINLKSRVLNYAALCMVSGYWHQGLVLLLSV